MTRESSLHVEWHDAGWQRPAGALQRDDGAMRECEVDEAPPVDGVVERAGQRIRTVAGERKDQTALVLEVPTRTPRGDRRASLCESHCVRSSFAR